MSGSSHGIDPSAVAGSDALGSLSDEASRRMLDHARMKRIKAGTAAFEQDQEADELLLLISGRLRVSKITPDGHQTTVRYLGPGESAGCVAVCGGLRYPATATAVEDSWALAWSRTQVQSLAGEVPDFVMNVMRVMAGRLDEVQHRLNESAHERVDRRIARAVMRLASQSGRRTDEGVLIDLPLSRQDLAEYAGTTLATVSRTLSRWEDEGLLTLGRQRVVVRDPHAMVMIAEDAPREAPQDGKDNKPD